MARRFRLDGAELRRFRRELQFIFQDPSGSLDPRMKVRDIVGEGLDAQGLERGARDRLIAEMLDRGGTAEGGCGALSP